MINLTVDQIRNMTPAELREFATTLEEKELCRLVLAMADIRRRESVVLCARCECELAVADGLCAPCTAEDYELDVRVVESDRPRYEGSGARLETKLNDTPPSGGGNLRLGRSFLFLL